MEMTHFATLAFAIVAALGVFTWICLPSAGRRIIATGAFVSLAICAFAAAVESTGQPKPVLLEWRDIDNSPVVGMSWDEGRQIVWLWLMQGDTPVAYVLPWPEDRQKFGQLQDRWRRRGSTGDEFQYNANGEVAKVAPPKQLPEKTTN